MNFVLAINLKMATVVGILKFISRTNDIVNWSEWEKTLLICLYFDICEDCEFYAWMSWAGRMFYNLRPEKKSYLDILLFNPN